ncbi:MAG: bifunctional transcriptional activator/DNA repair enzyme AdaA [Gemmataceae bacterium]
MMPHTETSVRQRTIVEQVCQYIQSHLEEDVSLSRLSDHVDLSPSYVQRTFKHVLGITPKQYVDACRLERLKSGLKTTGTVTSALFDAGYGSTSRLYERAAKHLGMTPGAYKRGGKDMTIGYTIGESKIGLVLLAGTQKGACMVSLGDSEAELVTVLTDEFPKAELTRDDANLKGWLQELLRHLAGEQPVLDLPLDVQATAFQWMVWQELCKIPYGSTKTYSEIAKAIDKPTAARAVGHACATNPVAIVVPCHRVIREDGQLGGYRWGLDRKKELIRQEQPEE